MSQYEWYQNVRINSTHEVFTFVSKSKNGEATKRVIFGMIEMPDIYNLAFGDVQEDGSINDFSISDNNDMEKILATIAKIIGLFFDKHPKSTVFFTGSTMARTRLYRMAIGHNWAELSNIYSI
jgi:hypothetical protein